MDCSNGRSGEWLREIMVRASTRRHSVTGEGPQMPSSHSLWSGWKRPVLLLSAPRPLRRVCCDAMMSFCRVIAITLYCIKTQYHDLDWQDNTCHALQFWHCR